MEVKNKITEQQQKDIDQTLENIRSNQRKCEELWKRVEVDGLLLADLRTGKKPRDYQDYLNATRDKTCLEWVEDDDLVQELKDRIELKKFGLLIRGFMTRDLNMDAEGLVEIELDGEVEDDGTTHEEIEILK